MPQLSLLGSSRPDDSEHSYCSSEGSSSSELVTPPLQQSLRLPPDLPVPWLSRKDKAPLRPTFSPPPVRSTYTPPTGFPMLSIPSDAVPLPDSLRACALFHP